MQTSNVVAVLKEKQELKLKNSIFAEWGGLYVIQNGP